ncbi:MAG: VOC family protein [Gammaproteobacteria bacterium]|jgi:glyoxylase I family protein
MADITAIHHVSLLVSDTARALAFYHGVLGLDVDDSRPAMDFPGAWLRVGAAQIHLLELPDSLRATQLPEHGGRDRHVALSVSGLDGVVAALQAAGVAYTLSRSGRRALFCRDPDGNALELLEWKPSCDA